VSLIKSNTPEQEDKVCKRTMETLGLNIRAAKTLIGKTIQWKAPGYKTTYTGIAIITAVDESSQRPLTVKTIEGDDLQYAFVNEYNKEDVEIGALCYSDGDRYVTYVIK
jgi:hypothetical protein